MTTQLHPSSEQSRPAPTLSADPAPHPATPPSAPAQPQPKRGRPFALDAKKRGVIITLVSQGYGLDRAARYVGCSVKTIRNDAVRTPEFGESLRNALLSSRLRPIQQLQDAIGADWRAAAWYLERTQPERFARRNPNALDARQLRRLLDEVLEIIDNDVADPILHARIANRLLATFEYRCRVACDRRRSKRDLRRAIEAFEQKAELGRPVAQVTQPAPRSKPVPANPIVIDQQPAGSRAAISGPSSHNRRDQPAVATANSPRQPAPDKQRSGQPPDLADRLLSVAEMTKIIPPCGETSGKNGN